VIESPEEGTAPEEKTATLPVPQASRRHGFEWGIAGVLLGGLIIGAILRIITPQAPLRQVRHLEITLPPALSISTPNLTELALSPDGTNLVFSAQQGDKTQLYQRRLDETEVKPIAGTEGGIGPFFSPDGASVAFLRDARAAAGTALASSSFALEKVSLTGGPVQSLCTNYSNFQGSWSSDGTIFFANTHLDGLARVPGTGGTCQDLTTPDKSQGEVSHWAPQVLPGGQSLLFNVFRGFSAAQGSIAVLSLKTGKWQTLIQGGTNPRYVPGGFLVYGRGTSLMAVPFDLASLKVSGSPLPVLENVLTHSQYGTSQLDFARDGTLAYMDGNAAEARRKVMLVDRIGKSQELTHNEGAYEEDPGCHSQM